MSNVIGVIGAAGLVGREVVAALLRHDVEPEDVRFYGSQRTEGEEADYGEEALPIELVSDETFRECDVVILAVPAEAAKGLAEQARKAGVVAIDLSGFSRLDAAVPLIAPGIAEAPRGAALVSLATPAAQALALALKPLRDQFGLAVVDVTLMVGAAWHGTAGVERLTKQTAGLMNGLDPEAELFPHRLAFNVIPALGGFEKGLSAGERTLLVELARLWANELPAVTATALQIPTYHGQFMVVSAHLKKPADVETIRSLLKADARLKLIDAVDENVYPMPMLTTDDPAVHVGRIRAHGERVQLLVAVDGASRMAETAVDIALRPAADA